MAYISTILEQTLNDTLASYTVTLPPHVTNDLLVIYITNDVGTTDITTATGGWTKHGTFADSGAGSRGGFFSKLATSSSETNPVFSGAAAVWGSVTKLIKDADTTTPIDGVSTRTDWNNVRTFTSSGLTTATNNCLLLYGYNADGLNYAHPAAQNDLIFAGGQPALNSAGVVGHVCAVGSRYLDTAGAVPTITWNHEVATEGGNAWVLAVRNKSGGLLGSKTSSTGPTVLEWGGGSTTPTNYSTIVAANNIITTINSITVEGTLSLSNQTALANELTNSYDRATSMNPTAATAKWAGAQLSLLSNVNLTGKIVGFNWSIGSIGTTNIGTEGALICYIDTSNNWKAIRMSARTKAIKSATSYLYTHNPSSDTAYASSGTMNWAVIKAVVIVYHSLSATGSMAFRSILAYDKYSIITVGGNATQPNNFAEVSNRALGWGGGLQRFLIQGVGQVLGNYGVQIGDGTIATYFKSAGQSIETPLQYDSTKFRTTWSLPDYSIGILIKLSASCTLDLGSSLLTCNTPQDFEIDSASSTSGTYIFNGLVLNGPWRVTNKTGITWTSTSISGAGIIDAKGGTYNLCNIGNSTAASYAMDLLNGANITNTKFTKGSETYALRIAAAGTFVLQGSTFTGYTTAINVTATTGTVTLTILATDSVPTYTTAGATVVINQPINYVGVSFTGLLTGSQVVVYTAGTTTELFRTNSSTTSASYSIAGSTITLDYTIQKAGYIPIRVTNLTTTVVQAVVSQQQIDRAYATSSGLTYGTTSTVNTGSKLFAVTVATTVQNWYSFMIESWISQSALRNIAFPVITNGPNSFSLVSGWEWTSSASINLLSRDGFRYVDVSGVQTAVWSAILSSGTATGFQGRYQQQDGTPTTNTLSTGPFDQLIQVYGDSTHGNFDKRGYLHLKFQPSGYLEVDSDVVATYGSLEDQLYVVGMQPTSSGEASGSPTVNGSPTITDHGASPVTWNGITTSITITDSAGTNSGSTLMRWIAYNKQVGGTFQGKDGFNWHDLIQQNGTKYKTVRGAVYGDVGATLKGVRVVKSDGTTPHPDFSLFTGDNGSTYAPPAILTASITNIILGSRLQVYNTTTSTEVANLIVAGTSWSLDFISGVSFTIGDAVRIRLTCQSGTTACQQWVTSSVVGTTGFSVLASQANLPAYTDIGIDGSTVVEYSLDVANIQADANDVDGVSTKKRFVAWFYYALTTASGIRNFFGAVTLEDAANAIIHTSLINLKLDNISAQQLYLSDSDFRLYTDDNSDWILFPSTGGYGISTNSGKVYVGSGGGGSGATLAEIEGSTVLAKVATVTSAQTAIVAEINQNETKIDTAITAINTKASQTSVNSIPTNPLLTTDTRLNNLDATVSSRLATAGYTVPPTAVQNRTEMDTNSTKLSSIDNKTTNLPTDPSDQSVLFTALQVINDGVKKASKLQPHSTNI